MYSILQKKQDNSDLKLFKEPKINNNSKRSHLSPATLCRIKSWDCMASDRRESFILFACYAIKFKQTRTECIVYFIADSTHVGIVVQISIECALCFIIIEDFVARDKSFWKVILLSWVWWYLHERVRLKIPWHVICHVIHIPNASILSNELGVRIILMYKIYLSVVVLHVQIKGLIVANSRHLLEGRKS